MLLASSEVDAQMQKLPASPHKARHLCSEFFPQKTKQSTKFFQCQWEGDKGDGTVSKLDKKADCLQRDMCSSRMIKVPAKKLKCC